ncbi:MAG: alkaline phosphatase [Sphingomonas sp. 28-62-20]|uniref:DedA family protein n=1 Tax=Sphingomonas sp. 28-62-20 TaxID=1970433 RepID=UPI000BD707D2|nr:MAG: alkaline phosphatase [Sphingomonas sp. 28-62-20]
MTELLMHLLDTGGYLGIFLLMVLENIIPPVPSEVIMGLGGIAVAQGRMHIVPLMIAGTVGSVLGNAFWYEIGHRLGHERFRPFIDRYGRWLAVEWRDVESLQRFFAKHGQWVVFVFRFMPIGRTVVSIPAGLSRMTRTRFLLWSTAGITVWNAVLVGAGYWLGTRFQDLDRYLGPAATALLVLAVLAYAYRVVTWRH